MITSQFQKFRRPRSGAAFLLLVVGLLVVVTGATFQLVKGEWTTRRSESQQYRAETMERAIEAVTDSSEPADQAIRLPIDSSQWIEVKAVKNDRGDRITADWVRNGNVIDTMSRETRK